VAGQSGGQHRVVQHAAVVHQAAPDLQTTAKAAAGISNIIVISEISSECRTPTRSQKKPLQLSIWLVHD
jgi:hypothetical protein